jgi:hypothetical protein
MCKVVCNDDECSVKKFHMKVVRNYTNGTHDTGAWQSDDADLDITWKDGGGGPWNRPLMQIARGALGKDFGVPINTGLFSYTLKMTRPGKPAITLDPEVDVNDGGPPGIRKRPGPKPKKKKSTKKRK